MTEAQVLGVLRRTPTAGGPLDAAEPVEPDSHVLVEDQRLLVPAAAPIAREIEELRAERRPKLAPLKGAIVLCLTRAAHAGMMAE